MRPTAPRRVYRSSRRCASRQTTVHPRSKFPLTSSFPHLSPQVDPPRKSAKDATIEAEEVKENKNQFTAPFWCIGLAKRNNSIECAVRGSLTGSGEAVEAMRDTGTGAPPVDPAQYNCRVVFTMETPDERYAERLNFGLWVASCVRKGQDVVCE